MTYPNAAQHYLEKQIVNASPAERIVLCYDGAIKFLTFAKRAIEEKNIQERYNNNKRACDIIAYLQETLNVEQGGEVGNNLYRLYGHMLARLVAVDMHNDVTAIDEVITMLRELNVSWKKISSGDVDLNGSGSTQKEKTSDVSATESEENSPKRHNAIA